MKSSAASICGRLAPHLLCSRRCIEVPALGVVVVGPAALVVVEFLCRAQSSVAEALSATP